MLDLLTWGAYGVIATLITIGSIAGRKHVHR